jgi:hypothetical protein
MFYVMVRDIQQAGYALPAFSSYNGQDIPFAYPPFALYLGALVPAVYVLMRGILPSRAAAGFAIVAFVLMPRSHAWLLVGGGLTRATGLLFAVLALIALHRMFTTRDLRRLWAAVPLTALSVVSHPEIGWFTAFSAVLFCAFYGLHKQGLLGLAVTGLGAIALTSPWWGAVLLRHGPDPFLTAAGTGNHHEIQAFLTSLVKLQYTEEGSIPLLAALGVVGAFPAISSRLYLVPIWLVALFILEPRSAATYATIPLAMLIGLLFDQFIAPLAPWRRRDGHPTRRWRQGPPEDTPLAVSAPSAWRSKIAIGAMSAGFVVVSAYIFYLALTTVRASNAEVMEALSPGEVQGMTWVTENTPPDSRFAVLTYDFWADDAVTEWFPALTGRQSLSTAQGREWVPGHSFQDVIRSHDDLALCTFYSAQCIEDWSAREGVAYDYVFLSQHCCSSGLIDSLVEPRGYRMVFSNGAVGIWKYERPPA